MKHRINSDIADVRLIAFYLPQFHPIVENDRWWGKGFCDWTNVAKTKPLFPGHYQPHLPADLGFYDLRLTEAREAQAKLAREHGIFGFCYYHYWFNGRRILERPFNEVLVSGKPDLPFCLCWANENWTRVWDGGDHQIILEQKYSHEDDIAHIEWLIPAFLDKRYIKINGKPLFLVYRTELLPDPSRTAEIWRDTLIRAGIGEIYLARVESFADDIKPMNIGFDAAVEFAPDWRRIGSPKYRKRAHHYLAKLGLLSKAYIVNQISDYQEMVNNMIQKPEPDFMRFRCVTPGFDNSARRSKDATIILGSTPEAYGSWLREIIVSNNTNGDERIIFINAWNEWAEGNHLEPDLRWGRTYLEATRRALESSRVPKDA